MTAHRDWRAWWRRLEERLESSGQQPAAVEQTACDASVLAAIRGDESPAIIVIRRAPGGRHGGQFALPGGRVEAWDADSWATALREAREEVGVDPEVVRRIGQLGTYSTVTSGVRVAAHVGRLEVDSIFLVPQPDEVAEIFEVPLDALRCERLAPVGIEQPPIDVTFQLELERFSVAKASVRAPEKESRRLPGGVPPSRIWGLTARILQDLLSA